MAKLERTYNVPLRKEFRKAPRYKKAKKAVKALREFLARHMKVELENVKIGKNLNEKVWERGIKRPPHHVKVTAVKEDDVVKAELFGVKYIEPVKPGEAEKPKTEKKDSEKEVDDLKKELEKTVSKAKKTVEKAEEKPKAEKKAAKEEKTEIMLEPVKKETKEPAVKIETKSVRKDTIAEKKETKKTAAKKATAKKTTKN